MVLPNIKLLLRRVVIRSLSPIQVPNLHSYSTECSPEWVSKLDAKGFIVKAAFVGFTDATHIDSILAHAKDNKHDWINEWVRDDTNIRTWVHTQAELCKELKFEAESHGYPFFDISNQPFEDYKSAVLDYFLQVES
jgi:hypothetical protein